MSSEVLDLNSNAGFANNVREDLARSGLVPSDMKVKPLTQIERHVTGLNAGADGYVIPYFNLEGKVLPFYRVKCTNIAVKYKQLAQAPNHIYFPPGLSKLIAQNFGAANNDGMRVMLLVEGEKKAAAAVKAGIPACAVSGVDSWRNKTLNISKESGITQTADGHLSIRLTAGAELTEATESVAVGFSDLINLCVEHKVPLVIIYDTSIRRTPQFADDGSKLPEKVTPYMAKEVQVAAATLGYELRSRGLPAKHIRQLGLRPSRGYEGDKLGLDDFLVHKDLGPDALRRALHHNLNQPSAFPPHPNPREYVNKKLQKSRMPRTELQSLSMAILCDLDSKGRRLYRPDDGTLYYFSRDTSELLSAGFKLSEEFVKTPFGVKLYKDYNLTVADSRVLEVFSSQFTGEDPCEAVYPEKVLTLRGNTLYMQISGGKVVKVSSNNIEIKDNGTDNILFEAGVVEDLDDAALLSALGERIKDGPQNYWYETLKEARIQETEDDKMRKLLSLLYSISPFFYRWNMTQLPIEMMIGEPGSGKSSLYILRLQTLTGIVKLRNAPKDLMGWAASLAHTGGLHVTDNVHMTDNGLRQQLSDEMCRIVTEPNPSIEQRKYYTNSGTVSIPIQTVFAVTAVKQPFTNPDIIQRSIIATLDKGSDDVSYEADWVSSQLARNGGRAGWLANQILFQQAMFKLIETKWKNHYKAKFRLINIEQLLMLAAEVYGDPECGAWLPDFLDSMQRKVVGANDETLAGLKAFAEDWVENYGHNSRNYFGTKEITEWAQFDEDFKKRHVLTNSRALGKYLETHKNMVTQITGIVCLGNRANRQIYVIEDVKPVNV